MATGVRPWYRWHVNRWRNSPRVLAMCLAEQGAYRNLLDAGWENQGQIPNQPQILWRYAMASSPAEWDAVSAVVISMFDVSDDGKWLTNNTLSLEWKDASEWFDKKSKSGKMGAESRWHSDANGDAIAMPMAKHSTSPHHTSQHNTEPKPPSGENPEPSANGNGSHEINSYMAAQAFGEMAGFNGTQNLYIAKQAMETWKRRKPDVPLEEAPKSILDLWRQYDGMEMHGKVSMKTFLGELGRFMDSDTWRKKEKQAFSPQIDWQGGYVAEDGCYVNKNGKRVPGFICPPRPNGEFKC